MTEDFNKWWDSDGIAEENSYREGSPVFWAWEGWQAAVKAEREWQGLTAEENSEIYNRNYNLYAHDMHIGDFFLIQQAVEAKLKEKNA